MTTVRRQVEIIYTTPRSEETRRQIEGIANAADVTRRRIVTSGAESSRAFQQVATAAGTASREVAGMERAGQQGAGGYRRAGAAAQQAGYQIGDFAVQVASGQSALVAFTQQASQLLGFLGPWGAVLGAGAAVAGALAVAFIDTRGASERFQDGLKSLGDQQQILNDLLKETETGLTGVADAFRRADAFQQQLIRSNLEESIRKGTAAIREQAAAIKELTGDQELFRTVGGSDFRPSTATGIFRPAEGLSRDQGFRISEALRAFEQSDGGLEAARGFAAALIEMRRELDGSSPAFTAFADQLLTAIDQSVRAGSSVEALKDQLNRLGTELPKNAEAVRELDKAFVEAAGGAERLRASALSLVESYDPLLAAKNEAYAKVLLLRDALLAGAVTWQQYQAAIAGVREEYQRSQNPLGAALAGLQAELAQLKLSDDARRQAVRVQAEYNAAVKAGAPANDATRKAIEADVAAIVKQEKANAAATKAAAEADREREREAEQRTRLSAQRADAIGDLQAELAHQVALRQAHAAGGAAIAEVTDLREAHAVVQRLKLEQDSDEARGIVELVGQINREKRAIETITDAQREAGKAAERAAREQKQAAEDARRAYERVIDNIADFSERALGDSFYETLRGETTDFAAFLEATLLRAIANVAAAAATTQIVMPIATGVVGAVPGVFGLSGPAAGVASQAGGSIFGGLFDPITSAITNGFSAVTGGISSFLFGTATAASPAAAAGVFGVAGGAATASAGGTAGLLGAGGAANVLGPALAGAMPYLAAAAIAIPLLMGAFGRKPSVGPTGVARLPAVIGDSEIQLTSDNGGSPDAAEAVAEQIRNVATSASESLGAFGSRNYGLDIGAFLQPEKGNSQPAGFNIKEIIDGQLAGEDLFKGLSAEEAVTEGVRLTLQKAFDGFDKEEVSTALSKSAADTIEELLADLDFANILGTFTDGGIAAVNELLRPLTDVEQAFKNLAKATEDGKDKAEELGLSVQEATEYFAALRTELVEQTQESFDRRIRDARGEGVYNAIDDLITQREADARSAAAAGLDVNANAGGLFDSSLRATLSGASLADLGQILASGQVLDAGARAIIQAMINEQALAAVREQAAAATELAAAATEQATRDQIAGLEDLADESRRFAAAAGDNARALRKASAELLVSDLSPLSAFERLSEARRQFGAALALANDADPTDDESQRAIGELPSLSTTLLQLSRDYYASSTEYQDEFGRVQDGLASTALRQESIEEQQLAALRDIEQSIADLGEGLSGAALTPSQRAAAAGFQFGTSTANNMRIYDALVAAGLPTPQGFGPTVQGNIGQLRASNPAVDAFLRAMGFANGGAFVNGTPVNLFAAGGIVGGPTAFGMAGGELGIMGEAGPEAIMPLDRINGRLGVRAILPANDGGDLRALQAEMRALRREAGELLRQLAQITATGALRVAGAVERGSEADRRMASAAERMGARPQGAAA